LRPSGHQPPTRPHTPSLLAVARAVLAGMPPAQVMFLCAVDMMMVGGGFAAQMVTAPEQKWPMFIFSVLMFVIITWSLLTNMRSIAKLTINTVEGKTFKFLSLWTLGLWSFYPVLFILDNAKVLNYDIEAVIHCVLDTLAKGEARGRGGGGGGV
jgi:bacteriorhodopsin